MAVFARDRSGRLVVTLHALDAAALAAVAADVRALLQSPPPGSPVTERMFPRAYLDHAEEEAERDWQDVVHPDLVLGKVVALDDLRALLERPARGDRLRLELAPEQEERFLAAVNDIRLTLGAAIGVGSETDLDPSGTPADDPRRLMEWLGMLEEEMVELLLSELPE